MDDQTCLLREREGMDWDGSLEVVLGWRTNGRVGDRCLSLHGSTTYDVSTMVYPSMGVSDHGSTTHSVFSHGPVTHGVFEHGLDTHGVFDHGLNIHGTSSYIIDDSSSYVNG